MYDNNVLFSCLCEDDVPVSQTNSSKCGIDPVLVRARRDVIMSRDLISGEDFVIKDELTGESAAEIYFPAQYFWTCINN